LIARRRPTSHPSGSSRDGSATDLGKIFRPEFAAAVDGPARNHELAFTAVVDRLRSLGRHGHMSLDDLPDEQAVGPNHASITETAFEIRVALRDQGRRHLGRPLRAQAKPLEFVDLCTVAIADADGNINEVESRQIDDALLRAP
jgi:hypothetical protein